MNWKESKLVGVIALLLVIAAAAFIVLFLSRSGAGGPYEYFLCDSTGRLFRVQALPSNEDYVENYLGVEVAEAAPCKICGKKDAYRAIRGGGGKWIKDHFAYFECDSTGEVFDVSTEPGSADYDPQLLGHPGEPVKCLVCDKEDAYMVRLDDDGNWVRLKPGESLVPEEEIPPGVTPPEPAGEDVGWDAIVQREAEKRREAAEEAAGAEDAEPAAQPAETEKETGAQAPGGEGAEVAPVQVEEEETAAEEIAGEQAPVGPEQVEKEQPAEESAGEGAEVAPVQVEEETPAGEIAGGQAPVGPEQVEKEQPAEESGREGAEVAPVEAGDETAAEEEETTGKGGQAGR